MKQVEVLMLLQEQVDAEDKTLSHVRQIEDEARSPKLRLACLFCLPAAWRNTVRPFVQISNFLRMRMVETAMPRLQVSLFDEERNEKAKRGLRERVNNSDDVATWQCTASLPPKSGLQP